MATLTIRSGLSGFHLIRHISNDGEGAIAGSATFDHSPVYMGLEAMAQLAALDVRRRIDFRSHAFLLKIVHCRWPVGRPLDGCFGIRAIPGSRSRRAFAYSTRARGPTGQTLAAKLMIGTVAYDENFQQQHLENYYRNLFRWLQNDISEG